MTTRLVLNHWEDWLVPGNPNDSLLLHAEASDRILICPSCIGQGYVHEILLREDLFLCIHDYQLSQDVMIEVQDECDRLEFEFQLIGPDAGYGFFVPYFGLRSFGARQSHKRHFKVGVFFQQSTLINYFQSFMERLLPPTQAIAERVLQALCERRCSRSTPAERVNQFLQNEKISNPALTFEQHLPNPLYAEAIALDYAARTPITSAMETIIRQILSCPYQGITRRTYLEQKALALVSMKLNAMEQPRLNTADLSCIYQAETLLRQQVVTPPTVETLARQVCTNRFKLNQGFHEVYGTTPYGYLRDYRLRQARWLLMTTDLSVGQAALTVGYQNRSSFAIAFRQKFGVNPKELQMQVRQCAS